MATRVMEKTACLTPCHDDVSPAPLAAHSSPTPPPRVPRVVLVHGIRKGEKSKLKDHLETRGFEVYVPVLDHPDGRGGLENLASGLKRDIDKEFGPKESISIVGFSMGGIVSRQYLQHLGGAARCENFITISAPITGPRWAGLSDERSRTDATGQPVPGGTRPLGRPPRENAGDLAAHAAGSGHRPAEKLGVGAGGESGYPVILHPLMLEPARCLRMSNSGFEMTS